MPSNAEAAAEATVTKIATSHLCDYDSLGPKELTDEIVRRHGIGETIPSLIKDFPKFCRIMPSDAEAAVEATFTKIATSNLWW